MKTILCYGDSHVRGFIPGTFDEVTGLAQRYTKNKRWTGILQYNLGDQYDVIEAGLNGRTTHLDEIIPGRLFRNGLKQLPCCLETHYPLDLVIIMLGTNDTQTQYNKSTEDIALGMQQLVKLVKLSNKGPAMSTPKILLIAPPPILEMTNLPEQYNHLSAEKSKKLATLYQRVSQEEECDFLDAGLIVTSSSIDGMHLDESAYKLLAHAVTQKVNSIFT